MGGVGGSREGVGDTCHHGRAPMGPPAVQLSGDNAVSSEFSVLLELFSAVFQVLFLLLKKKKLKM